MVPIAIIAMLGAVSAVDALEVLQIETTRSRGMFTLEAQMILDASPDEVWAILNDLDDFSRLDRAVIISHVIGRDEEGNPIAHQRLCGCVGFLCRRIDKTDVYYRTGPYRIEASTVPGTNDLESNTQIWELVATEDGRTEMHTRWDMDPDFWVPPLIGTYAVRRALDYLVPRMGHSIEYFAAVDAGREPTGPEPPPTREHCRELGEDEH